MDDYNCNIYGVPDFCQTVVAWNAGECRCLCRLHK